MSQISPSPSWYSRFGATSPALIGGIGPAWFKQLRKRARPNQVSSRMADTPGRKAIMVSREDLFRQVWTTPMSRLARDYGVSGNGLAKICDRLKVPYPPRGYWAKKAAGKKVIQYRLPEREEDTPPTARISPTPPPVPPPKILPEVQQQIDAAKQTAGVVTVPTRMVRPHPIIASWLKEREDERARARREGDSWRRTLGPSDWTAIERRRHRVLDALFKAAERQGVAVKQPDRFTVYFEASGERVDFKLKEKHKQVRVPKTAEEIQRLRPGERTWRQQQQPTGTLSFSIETYLPSLPRSVWIDTAAQPLEEQLGDILATCFLPAPCCSSSAMRGTRPSDSGVRRNFVATRRLNGNA